MKTLTPFLICLLSVNILFASTPEFHSGAVVLQSNDVLTGRIAIHESHDLVLFQGDDGMMVLPAFKVRTVLYYDAKSDINRKFVAIADTENFRLHYRIFEVVLSGDITVLRRNPALWTSRNDDAAYDYFLFVRNEVMEIRKFRSKIYPDIIESSSEMAQFVKVNRLCPSSPADIIQIIAHHNRINASGPLMADQR